MNLKVRITKYEFRTHRGHSKGSWGQRSPEIVQGYQGSLSIKIKFAVSHTLKFFQT